ncbi:MAG: ribbon-helix-helix protein, CopG family [Thermoanaerobaculia bacterium]
MRTTVRLPDELLRDAKRLAQQSDRTLTTVIETALRQLLDQERRAQRPRPPLPTFKGRGLQAGVDLDDSAALLALMEAADDDEAP